MRLKPLGKANRIFHPRHRKTPASGSSMFCQISVSLRPGQATSDRQPPTTTQNKVLEGVVGLFYYFILHSNLLLFTLDLFSILSIRLETTFPTTITVNYHFHLQLRALKERRRKERIISSSSKSFVIYVFLISFSLKAFPLTNKSFPATVASQARLFKCILSSSYKKPLQVGPGRFSGNP